ncbi:hypothetical protein HDU79_009941 [Rhizoclosmatium sp. JEL0117]|nr:hypothetical protein HDU79_009941 [Rhizoclosmatium sp. JEL0117]
MYKTLSITKTADLATIKKAYYSKVFHLHPDRLASLPGGAPKPGTPAHAAKTTEFMQTVKSFEILSDPDRRRAYDMDSARGDTARYAREAKGEAPDSGTGNWKADYNWDPRNPYGRGPMKEGFNEDYATYYGPMNTGPIYAPNWQVALAVMTIAAVAGSGILYVAKQRIKKYEEEAAFQDQVLGEYYAKKKAVAAERGFRGTVEHVRGLDKSGGTEVIQVDGHDVQHKE